MIYSYKDKLSTFARILRRERSMGRAVAGERINLRDRLGLLFVKFQIWYNEIDGPLGYIYSRARANISTLSPSAAILLKTPWFGQLQLSAEIGR